jgi:hypothetical protein
MIKYLAGTRLYFEIRITLRSAFENDFTNRAQKALQRATADKANRKVIAELTKKLKAAQYEKAIIQSLITFFWGGESPNDEAQETLATYTKGIFNPVLRGMLVSRREMRMTDAQLQFAKISKTMVNKYRDCILKLHKEGPESNPFPKRPHAVVNTNTFGGGKTSVASFATAYQIHDANVALRNTNHRIVGVYILPSLDTILSFASASSQHYVTWLAQRGSFMVFHKWCPWVKTGNRRQPERVYKYVEKGLQKRVAAEGLTICDQAINIRDWHNSHKDASTLPLTNNKEYHAPDMIFADPASALLLLEEAQKFQDHESLHWHFLPIIDEFPATADCGIPLEKNELLMNVFHILMKDSPFCLLMSASPTEEQMTASSFFSRYDMEFAELTRATNSFTQLYLHNGQAVHPFAKINPEDVPAAVQSWDETTYRCFPPRLLLALRDTLQRESGEEFPLSLDDIRNPTSVISLIQRLCKTIAASDLKVRTAVCNLKLTGVPETEVDPRTTLTLLSGDFFGEVLAQLGDRAVDSKKIDQERENFEKRCKTRIASLIVEMKSADREGAHLNRDQLKAKIDELELQLSNEAIRLYRFTTPLGSVTIDLEWINKYRNSKISEDTIKLLLSGLRMDMRDDFLNTALYAANPQPVVAFAPIACMFGLNDARTDNVCIHDYTKIVGPDTLKQALARAGRSGKKNFIVAGHVDEHLLNCFSGQMSTSIASMDVMYVEKVSTSEVVGGEKKESKED